MPRLRTKRLSVVVVAAVLTVVVASCQPRSGDLVTKLYFGLSSPRGEISAEQFGAFVDSAITPRFPDGLTVYEAAGQWRGADNTVDRERSMVVEIVHQRSADADSAVRLIAESYKTTYQQESVLIVSARPERVVY
jgi:hypothetical protein